MLLKSMFRNMTAFLALTVAIGAVSLVAGDSRNVPLTNCSTSCEQACMTGGSTCEAIGATCVNNTSCAAASTTPCSPDDCKQCPAGTSCERCCCPSTACVSGEALQCGTTL